MPLYTNTTLGTVSYQPQGIFNEGTILANDAADFVHDAFTNVSDFDIKLGANERATGNLILWYDSNNTSEFKFKFTNEDSAGTALAGSIFAYSVRQPDQVASDADSSPDNNNGPGRNQVSYNTDGDGGVITIDISSGNADIRFAEIYFNVLNSTSTSSTLKFYGGEIADSSDCHLLAGSYNAYKKF